MSDNFAIVILAAGQGKRMGGEKPKVLRELNGRPLIAHLREAIEKSGVGVKPTVVVCDEHNLVQEALGDSCDYAIQAEQLGTAHAVSCVRDSLKNRAEHILVLYGDHPLLSSQTIARLKEYHQNQQAVLTLMTTVLPDFNEWRAVFKDFGRVLRNEKEEIIGIVERRDATPEQIDVREVNPMYCCFKADWLWANLDKIDNKNVQGEYYLTDLVKLAFGQGEKIATLLIENQECLGVNRPEELAIAEKFF